MAGHSKFKNIQYRKGAQDKKRAKQFAKIGREIQIAVKIGGTVLINPRLPTIIPVSICQRIMLTSYNKNITIYNYRSPI